MASSPAPRQRGTPVDQTITVPFPWGSKLSGIENQGHIAWSQRTFTVPADWKRQRIFLVVGASDWITHAWLDGKSLGEHGEDTRRLNLT